jgi:hypothetical protein
MVQPAPVVHLVEEEVLLQERTCLANLPIQPLINGMEQLPQSEEVAEEMELLQVLLVLQDLRQVVVVAVASELGAVVYRIQAMVQLAR